MLKFMRFGDDEDAVNAKDALLLWIQNKTASYKNLKVENFKKGFKDGLALCALIHKHRPNLIDYDSLTPGSDKNIQVAFDAAEKYFNLEQYLTPEDFKALDENSMVVYAAEYYHGIAEQRKVDLAVRRVDKLIKLTEENDEMRAKHNAGALKLKEHMTSVEKLLSDRTIDNTMAGAKKRIADFYEYKTKDKGEILADQLSLEALFNNLAMRLAHHKRPEYVPPEGCKLSDVEAAVAHLEECEQERNVALHAELNRQIKLVRWNDQHTATHQKMKQWVAEKEAYLNTKEVITSVGDAFFQISVLDAYNNESRQLVESSIAAWKALGDELDKEVYEGLAAVRAREHEVDADIERLTALSAKKKPVLDDDLAREQFREGLRLQNQEHNDMHENIQAWVAGREQYLTTKESISSVAEAQTQLSLLDSYEAEKVMMGESSVAQLKALGAETKASKYETQYSSAACETVGEIDEREAAVDAKWASLTELSVEKRAVLDDDLAREKFKAHLRLLNAAHADKFAKISKWVEEKEAYLNTKEEVSTVAEAEKQLNLLEQYEKEKAAQSETSVAALKALGQEILTAKYETKYSAAAWEAREEIAQREAAVDAKWASLSEQSAHKKAVLEDDLAREIFNDKLRAKNHNHTSQHAKIAAWADAKDKYLATREPIDTVSGAQTHIKLLAAYEKDNGLKKSHNVAMLTALGQEILTAKYETKYSSSQWNTPEEVKQREANVEQRWATLAGAASVKSEWLKSELAREEKKEELRLKFANLAGDFARYCKDMGERAAASQFGFDLPEVQAFKATLDASDAEAEKQISVRSGEYQGVFDEAAGLGVKENVYTKHTPDTLKATAEELRGALGARRDAYAKELAKQEANDALCKAFAEMAEPLAAFVKEHKDKITHSKADLEAQLAFVDECAAAVPNDKLAAAQEQQAKIDAAGITNNRHTLLSAKDLQVQFGQYEEFLKQKKQMLEEAIEHAKLRGITPEQYKEIESNFNSFDASGSGSLNAKELKACLYSLGEEKGRKEVHALMEEFAGAGATELPYEGYKEFMISLLGDADTQPEIVDGFKLMSRGSDVLTEERMEVVSMPEHDREYIKKTAPAADGGWDYNAWTADVFSR
eukprot:TRINITY_DN177_c0_g1_i1.p1 TRINITY_DN177_c0_g1~~TRINITY_DN177_c0_g1_i1.p1  ORF type:complete len:1232 (+),score=684.36 TRINITY_DN177_c0_g1_i1:352-3696(+)